MSKSRKMFSDTSEISFNEAVIILRAGRIASPKVRVKASLDNKKMSSCAFTQKLCDEIRIACNVMTL